MSSFSSRKVAWLMLSRQRLVTILPVDTGVLRSWAYQVLERIIAGDFPQLSCLEYATWAEVFNKHSCVWKCRHCHSGLQNRLDLAQDMNCSYSTVLTSLCVCVWSQVMAMINPSQSNVIWNFLLLWLWIVSRGVTQCLSGLFAFAVKVLTCSRNKYQEK